MGGDGGARVGGWAGGGGVSLRRLGVPVPFESSGRRVLAARGLAPAEVARPDSPRRSGARGRRCAVIYQSSLAPYQDRARLFGTRWRGLDHLQRKGQQRPSHQAPR
jgi:hypothetical protein